MSRPGREGPFSALLRRVLSLQSAYFPIAAVFFIAGLRPLPVAVAATKTWNAGSSSWATPQNWSPMPFAVPTTNETAQISNGGTANVSQNAGVNTLSLGTTSGTTGNLNIFSGATFGTFYAFVGDQGSGNVTVSGAGTTWTGNAPGGVYELRVGRFGTGRLDIRDDATVLGSYGGIAWEHGSTGVVNVTDASNWNLNYGLSVGERGNGTLNIRSASEVTSDSASIGSVAGATGRVELDGAGSKLTVDGALSIGYEGIGSFYISDGAALTSSKDWGGDSLGGEALSRGTLEINGGGTWNNYSVAVGRGGDGYLNIYNGTVTSTDHSSAGTVAGGNGEILVEGPMSKWINRSLTIGNSGHGILNIRGGALVDSRSHTGVNRDSYIGRRPGSTGIVTVEGNSTKWLNGGNLEVGGNFASTGGSGTLTIRGGANVLVGSLVEFEPRLKIWQQGQVNVEAGRVVVASGDSSSLSPLNGIYIGTNTTTGSIELEGGLLSSGGAVRVATHGTITGSGTITAPVTEVYGKTFLYQPRMNFPGTVLPRDGITQYNANLVINGDYEQRLNSELSLTNLSSSHQLLPGNTLSTAIVVNGTARLDGKLSLNFASGYAPPIGSRFGVIAAESMTGTMQLQNPTLPHVNGMADRFLGVNYRRNGEGGDPIMEVITLEQPRRITPERTPRPRNLLLVTHGTNADAEGWVTDLAFAMTSTEQGSRWLSDDWEVVVLDWRSFNGGSADPFGYNFLAHPEVSANTAAGNAINIGQSVVHWYTARGISFDNVHVLGHSAGTWLADAVADAFHATPHPEHVHATLFDAWNPPEGIRHQAVGPPAMADKADFADHYFHRNSAVWYTDTTFPTAVNLDLTDMETIVNPINSHAKPYNWYIETALSPADPAVAIDGWGAPVARIFSGMQPTYNTDHLGSLIQVTPQGSFLTELEVEETAFNDAMNVTTGDVSILPNDGGAILATASPAILNTMLNLEKAFEALQFNFEFLSANPGLLSVYFAGEQIFAFENGPLGLGPGDVLSSGLIWLGQQYAAGPHAITFRIDPLTELQASVKITDLEFVSLVAASSNLPGDFNYDNKVDAADYVVWRKTDGSPVGYNAWRTHFGQGMGSGSSAHENGAVPEPLAIIQLMAIGVLVSCHCGNRWRWN